jgi:hypothetical protein
LPLGRPAQVWSYASENSPADCCSKDSSFRLIVSGDVGVKEIERLTKKLQIDKEILAEVEKPKHILI